MITHKYDARSGVHWLDGDDISSSSGDSGGSSNSSSSLKVYYLPFAPVYDGSLPPTAIRLLPALREILARERITIVHAHAVCTMSLESTVLASLMGYRVVYTEHSHYGIEAPLVDVLLNKLCSAVCFGLTPEHLYSTQCGEPQTAVRVRGFKSLRVGHPRESQGCLFRHRQEHLLREVPHPRDEPQPLAIVGPD